ncbi:RNase adaptor protein RapZ [hot springs metagenome]|uniref:RNase adaptor protein RapZ n=1 Tax=hot springs metagenome TaxID=433727 RepID=A0A5J4L546_9ZZZZ
MGNRQEVKNKEMGIEDQNISPAAYSPSPYVVIVSGLSGAGKTVALRALEDIGFFCIDNLPVTLIESFLSTIKTKQSMEKIGISIDIREKEFLSDVYNILSSIKDRYKIEILFLEAEKNVMLRRYKETRRPHPVLSMRGEMDIETAIEEEITLLSVIRDAADRIIDTSTYTPHQLRHLITSLYGSLTEKQAVNISLISFGYKFGVPQNVDILFDVRFLPNPYFIPELKALKGTDPVVYDFVIKKKETKEFLSHITGLIDFLLPHYIREGRTYLVVGIGCTGGMHRSPAIVEEISKHIDKKHGIKSYVIHRDMV